MHACIVFTPDTPNLYTLNPSAWLVLELCDGRKDKKAIEAAYYKAIKPRPTRRKIRAELDRIFDDLERKGILEQVRADKAR